MIGRASSLAILVAGFVAGILGSLSAQDTSQRQLGMLPVLVEQRNAALNDAALARSDANYAQQRVVDLGKEIEKLKAESDRARSDANQAQQRLVELAKEAEELKAEIDRLKTPPALPPADDPPPAPPSAKDRIIRP